jgi:ribose 5-phosphate isomerase B
MKEKIFIACDHAAFNAKEALKAIMIENYEVIDLGTNSEESVHYPTYAQKLCLEIQKNPTSRGILLCGSGIGVSIVANRFKGIRAALCRDDEDAMMSRLHNNANVVCIGARKTSPEMLKKITSVFFSTPFEGGRHQDRIDLFDHLGV